MTSRLNPYITFHDTARAAMEFYQSVLGGELAISTFGEFGQEGTHIADLVMHSNLETPLGFTLMASDLPPGVDHTPGTNIMVCLSGDDGDALRGYFAGLAQGGTITMPLETQMWGDEFGQLFDKFGVGWMVNISGAA